MSMITPDDWDRRYAEPQLVWSAEPNRFLVEELAGLPPGRALDLACGEGRNAIWLARRGWEVTGVDFSGVAIDKAGRMAAEAGVEGPLRPSRPGRLRPRPRLGRPGRR